MAQNNEENQEEQKQQNSVAKTAGKAIYNKGKKVAKDAAIKAIKSTEAFAKAAAFITAHLTLFLTIGLVILGIIYIFGVYAFFTSMPGMVMGKLKEVGLSFWGDVKGFIIGDYDYVDSEDVTKLAQYLEDMGYSVQGYGFADVKYTDASSPSSQGKTKTVEKVTGVKYRNNYLHSYLAASEETYQLAKYSIWGDLNATGATLAEATKNALAGKGIEEINAKSYKDYSSGLLKINGTVNTGFIKFATEDLVKVNREAQTMEISQYALKFPFLDSFKFGMKFNYDLSDWTAKYGRPVEMFIALHVATGMPDLTYQISNSNDFNTKVNIDAQEVTIYFDDQTTFNIITPSGNEISKEKIEKAYLKYIVDKVKAQRDSYDKDNDLEKDSYYAWNSIYSRLRNIHNWNSKAKIHQFMSSFMSHSGLAGGYIKVPYNETFGTSITQDLLIPKVTSATTEYLSGCTNEQLMHLISLIHSGTVGIKDARLPYISSVEKHWFYETINFTVGKKGVYEAAEYARKSMKYEVDEGPIKDFDITINKALLHDETGKGILYQKREPNTHGPNASIAKLFHDNTYYRYDGTIETAEKIAKTILIKDKGKGAGYNYIFNGEIHTLTANDVTAANNDELALKQVPSFGSAQDTLSAFNILKQVDTLEAETSYRCLKELATSSEAIQEPINKSALTEELKQVLLWAFDDTDGNKTWKVEKDTNNYGIVVKDATGQKMIAPGDCNARVEDGKLILTFKKLKSNKSKSNPGTVQILKKHFQAKDFYKVKADEVYEMEMIIEGISSPKTGYIARGKEIGTANTQVKITMRHEDKSLVGNDNDTIDDDVEDYMNQDYTNYDEEQVRKAIKNQRDVADGGDNTGGDDDDDNGGGENPGGGNHESPIPDSDKLRLIGGNADGTFEYHGKKYDTLQLIYAIVAAEDSGSVDGAWGVITSAYNRMGKAKWAGNGSNLIEQLTAPNQYAVSAAIDKYFTKGNPIPQNAINGANKLIDDRKKNHGFDSFKTYGTVKGTNWIEWVEKKVMEANNCTRSQLYRYCRKIGGNYYHNGDFSAEE